MVDMVDVAGRELKIGQLVGVAFVSGHSPRIRVGKVLELNPDTNEFRVLYVDAQKESKWIQLLSARYYQRVVIMEEEI